MTREDLAGLLDTARDSLRNEVQPAVPPELRYPAAMVANAMAIAARGLAIGGEIEARQRTTLAALYGESRALSLGQLERRLARELRAGGFDQEREERIRAALIACVLARLELSNPEYASTYPVNL
jgi:hypothetical protein